MDIEELKCLINEDLTIRQIAARKNTTYSTIRYYLRKHRLTTNHDPHKRRIAKRTLPNGKRMRVCPCGETDPSKFYGKKMNICSKCHSEYNRMRAQENRRKLLDYFGGKCLNCGYDNYSSALATHHLDPDVKDEHFRGCYGWAWERLKKEIQSCIMLCKNCHSAIHNGELMLELSHSINDERSGITIVSVKK